MTAYTFQDTGAFSSALTGGNMTPAMPTFSAGSLLLLETGCNSTSIGSPAITGYTRISPNSGAPCSSLYARIAQLGDTSPTFQWNPSIQAYSRITSFSGDVYTDLSTIVSTSSDRGTNASGALAVASTAVPAQTNCMVIRGGHCVKTSTNNGSSFNDWTNNSGLFTKVGNTQLVQNGTALAAALWFWQQTTATGTSSDIANLTNTDSTGNTQGFTIILKTAATAVFVPNRPLSQGAIGVQMCQ
jgi:hypothetical protein